MSGKIISLADLEYLVGWFQRQEERRRKTTSQANLEVAHVIRHQNADLERYTDRELAANYI
jgi:hypothetical protein